MGEGVGESGCEGPDGGDGNELGDYVLVAGEGCCHGAMSELGV